MIAGYEENVKRMRDEQCDGRIDRRTDVNMQRSLTLPPLSSYAHYPTDPFITLELQNPAIDVYVLNKFRQFPDFEALKLFKGPVGLRTSVLKRLH